MRVCVLSDEYIEYFNPAPYMKDYDWKLVTLTAPVFEKIQALADSKEFDVFLNICEGYEFEDEEDDEEDEISSGSVSAIRAATRWAPVSRSAS